MAQIVSEILHLPSVKLDLDFLLAKFLKESNYTESSDEMNTRIILGLFNSALCILLFLLSYNNITEYNLLIVIIYYLAYYLEVLLCKFLFDYVFIGYKNTNTSKDTLLTDNSKKSNYIKIVTILNNPIPIYTILYYNKNRDIPDKISIDITTIYNEKGILDYNKYILLIKEGISS
ncbi:hypothetical protein NEOKW01_0524 [Nematocida sp. AWRm80]|nr:hypothetical protein NEOKW01_0524 [Nematocida sp. AWRm80]